MNVFLDWPEDGGSNPPFSKCGTSVGRLPWNWKTYFFARDTLGVQVPLFFLKFLTAYFPGSHWWHSFYTFLTKNFSTIVKSYHKFNSCTPDSIFNEHEVRLFSVIFWWYAPRSINLTSYFNGEVAQLVEKKLLWYLFDHLVRLSENYQLIVT